VDRRPRAGASPVAALRTGGSGARAVATLEARASPGRTGSRKEKHA
jgi:hypothetical protein